MIDCHFHIWDINKTYYTWLTKDLKELYKNYTIEEYYKIIEKLPIKKSIIVQAAANINESKKLLLKANTDDKIMGVIAWVDFEKPNVIEDINNLKKYGKLLGLRPMLQDIKDENWIMNKNFDSIFKKLIEEKLVFEALIRQNHLKNIIYLAKKYPKLKIIINHCAKPNIKDSIKNNSFEEWKNLIEEASKQKNIFCKISGLVTQCEKLHSYSILSPYLNHVKNSFGINRLLWGSDWPVINLKTTYEHWLNITNEFFKTIDTNEKKLICEENAKRIYIK